MATRGQAEGFHITIRYTTVTLLTTIMVMLSAGRDVLPKKELYLPDYNVYHNLSRIESHLVDIVSQNPKYMQLDWMYKSRNSHPQMLLRITNFTDSVAKLSTNEMPVPKVKIFLSYGEHAREFLPIESLFHLLINLTTGLKYPRGSYAEEFSRNTLSKLDLFIVAMVNPDGRNYVEHTQNYCWRGTANGVDLNRNFDWQFGHKGSSGNKDDEEFRGSHPFSEPECLVLTELTAKFKFDAFISLHSGIKQIYVPFADTESRLKNRRPDNLEAMLELADEMSQAMMNTFSYGVAYQVNEYTADGTIFDFMSGVRKIPFSFAVELWGEGDHKDARCFDLFNPRNHELQKVVEDLMPLYSRFFIYMINWKQKQVIKMDPAEDAPSLTFGYILLCVVVMMTLIVGIHNHLPSCLRLYPRRRIVSLRSLSSTFTVMGALKLS